MQKTSHTERRTSILVVDDELDVADTGADILTLSGYDTNIAYSAADALAIVGGGVSGLELAEIVRDRFPAIALLLTTGQGDALAEAKAKGFETLAKPYAVQSLRAAIGRLRSPDQ